MESCSNFISSPDWWTLHGAVAHLLEVQRAGRSHHAPDILIVISGFIGRYIYTRIPRSLDGVEITDPGAQAQAATLARYGGCCPYWHAFHIPIGMALFVAAFIHIGAALYYATLLR